jgi:hypothetical protein
MKYWKRLPISYLLVVLIPALVVPSADSGDKKNAAQQTRSSEQAKAYVAPTDPGLDVGSDTCKACHEGIYTNFERTAHFAITMDGKLEAHKGVEWHGCEACHGPGKEHVDSGGVTTVNGLQRNQNVGVSLALTPTEKFSTQLGYNYNTIYSQIHLCFTSSARQPGLPPCPEVSSLFQQFAPYTSSGNTGFIDFQWTPLNRLALDLAANISAAAGSQLNLNPQSTIPTAPTGALNSSWYEPYGSIAYHFAKNWTGKALWNYYGYHEDSNGSYQDLFVPRNFRGNTVTLSARFAFNELGGATASQTQFDGEEHPVAEMETGLGFARTLRIAERHETKLGDRHLRSSRTPEKTTQGGNDEESFVRNSNRSNVVPGRVHFARSRSCERGENFQGKVCQLSRRQRGRQASNEVARDQGQECRRNHESVLPFAEAR